MEENESLCQSETAKFEADEKIHQEEMLSDDKAGQTGYGSNDSTNEAALTAKDQVDVEKAADGDSVAPNGTSGKQRVNLRKMESIKDQMDNPLGVLGLMCVMCGALCCLVSVAILGNIVSISSIVIGSIYINDCPAEKHIPIYLIVAGAVAMFQLTLRLCIKGKNSADNETAEQPGFCSCLDGLLGLFTLAWFIAGSVWVFQAAWPNMADPSMPTYCNPTVFYFAFVLLCIAWALSGLMFAVLLLACCYSLFSN